MARVARQLAIITILFITLLLIAPAASPIRLGYVTSDSMNPTISPNDGYIAIPSNNIETGDIVVYWSSTRNEYVTHRVVDETDVGFITKGDNNDQTDQQAGLPPVPQTAIVGKILTIGTTPIILPGLGLLVAVISGYRILALAALLLAGAGILIRERGRRGVRRPGRSILRVSDVIEPLFLVAIVTFVAVTPLGAASYQLTFVATQDDTGTYTIPVDEPVSRTLLVDTPGHPLTTHVIESRGAQITDQTNRGSQTDVTVTIPPPGTIGPTLIAVTVYPYPAILPQSTVKQLHDIHPIAAIAGTITTVFGPLYILYRLALDRQRPLVTRRSPIAQWFGS